MTDKFGKHIILFRGLPSSGKTTLADLLCDRVHSADDFFYDSDGNYDFDPDQLFVAHRTCYDNVLDSLQDDFIYTIGVANTFTREKELRPYLELADVNVKVSSVIVEGRHGNKNSHNVPEETIEKMRNRFSVKL